MMKLSNKIALAAALLALTGSLAMPDADAKHKRWKKTRNIVVRPMVVNPYFTTNFRANSLRPRGFRASTLNRQQLADKLARDTYEQQLFLQPYYQRAALQQMYPYGLYPSSAYNPYINPYTGTINTRVMNGFLTGF